VFRFAEHTCGDCLLKCIDCSAQICPKCLVQCPVGNRCRKCTNKFASHLLQIDIWVILRAFAGGFLAGLLFTGLEGIIPLGGFFMLLIVYILGSVAGNLIFKISKRKLGGKVALTVTAGLLCGSFSASSAWGNFYGETIAQVVAQSRAPLSAQTKVPGGDNHDTSQKAIDDGTEQSAVDDASYRAAYAAALARANMAPSPISLALIIFALGAITPFLGWGNPLSNLFRR